MVLLETSALTFWRHIAAGDLLVNIVGLLDQLLLVLMVVEILYTVQSRFESMCSPHPRSCSSPCSPPFGASSSSRPSRTECSKKGGAAFRAAMIELAPLIS